MNRPFNFSKLVLHAGIVAFGGALLSIFIAWIELSSWEESANSISGYRELDLPLGLAIAGFIATITGLVGKRKYEKSLQKNRNLSQKSKVRLPITEIRKAELASDGNTTFHVVVCRVLDTKGKVLSEFTSQPLRKDPAKVLAKHKEVDVYVDPEDVRNYYMDIPF